MLDAPASAAAGVSTSRHALMGALAAVVLATPGVVRLEPTLSTSSLRALLRPSPTDGLHVLHRGGIVDVDVNIATHATSSARAVACQVQASIAATLTQQGFSPGSVAVCVLTINP